MERDDKINIVLARTLMAMANEADEIAQSIKTEPVIREIFLAISKIMAAGVSACLKSANKKTDD
jgi:hypothetical protein